MRITWWKYAELALGLVATAVKAISPRRRCAFCGQKRPMGAARCPGCGIKTTLSGSAP